MQQITKRAHSQERDGSPSTAGLIELATQVVCDSFRQDYRTLFAHSDESCTLISACGPIFTGLKDMRENLGKHVKLPEFIIRDARFRIAHEQNDGSQITVVGSFSAFSDFTTSQTIVAHRMHVSMSMQWNGSEWRIFMMHFSMDGEQKDGKYDFPVKEGEQTYRYVRAILKAGKLMGNRDERVIISSGGTGVFVNPQALMYAEAQGKSTLLHLVEKVAEVRQLLQTIEGLLPSQFVRISRKHIVNCSYIVRMDGDVIELPDGTLLPLPRRRAKQLQQEIAERIEQLQTTTP